jgi:enoyl-CoA hydratase
MPLRVERRDRVAILTLDDPGRRNALSAELVDEIVVTMTAFESDDDVGALVVTGAPPAFCSGADVTALRSMQGRDGSEVRSIYDGFLSVRASSLPTVAAVNGPAVGAGFNLALCCDVRIAGESARFDSRFARIGLHPGGGHLWMLEREVGPEAAAAISLFGERIDAARAAEIGLVWRVVSDDALLDDAVAVAAAGAEVPRDLSAAMKATLRETPWRADFEAAVQAELLRQRRTFEQGGGAPT